MRSWRGRLRRMWRIETEENIARGMDSGRSAAEGFGEIWERAECA